MAKFVYVTFAEDGIAVLLEAGTQAEAKEKVIQDLIPSFVDEETDEAAAREILLEGYGSHDEGGWLVQAVM